MSNLPDQLEITNFEAHWDALSEPEQKNFIKQSEMLEPGTAVVPILKGLESPHFSVRSQARSTLNILHARIRSFLKNASDPVQYRKGMKASTGVCSKIFNKIDPTLSSKEKHYYFKLLLGFEGKGAYFAFKAIYMRRISGTTMEKLITTLPDSQRLELIREYLQAAPEVRLKHGKVFKQIILSINHRESVIKFFSNLFDAGQDADPFLYNIDPRLRDPDHIISDKITSSSPAVRQRGLKALAMILPKIPSDLLLEMLDTETDTHVRMTIYKIIENSTLGTYPEIFCPLLGLLDKRDESEAFHAFKALLVSGKLPLIEVIELVEKKVPHLMGHIYKEISTLGKISFFFLQDIALNTRLYFKSHLEINLAAVFGMIKKRPERVIRILKNSIEKAKGDDRNALAEFVKKTKQLLAKEKKSVEKRIAPLVNAAKNEPEPAKEGFLKTIFFSSDSEKNIQALKKGNRNAPVNLMGATLNTIDLSSVVCTKIPLYCNSASILNTNLSGAVFFNAFFKHCLFYKVNMQNTTFDSVCFDHAVFIEVDARSAVFKNCSFHHAVIHHSSFNQAEMKGASFVGANISNSSFQQTDLSGSSFAYSKLFAISFIATHIEQGDFSGINARFCRFPEHSRPMVFRDDVNLNAREYQLELDDVPDLDSVCISHINMLIFSEFIHYGEIKFYKQNTQSLLTAFDIFKPRQSDLFQIIPYLLHENISLAGMKDRFHPDTPYGIYGYLPGRDTLGIVRQYSGSRKISAARPSTMFIEGVFTIGSIGSMAQSNDSDIDYWICIQENKMNKTRLKLLKEKLARLETWALQQFKIQVTFFLVDLARARNNNFGDSTFESSGSAQTRLLKEEFYRTMIYVAGKPPLWAVLPTSISKKYYKQIFKTVSAFPNFSRYLDLGDVHRISPGEFFGASIWQMFKSLKSPFKSIIKMALLEKSIHEYDKPLLCSIYKDEWMNSGVNLKLLQNDAYYILLENLLTFYEQSKDKESARILLTCFFLKLGISKESEMTATVFGLRRILLEKCMARWNWSISELLKFGGFKSWPYQDIAKFSQNLESFLIRKYKTVNQAFDKAFGEDQAGALISAEDRTVLTRKVHSELSKGPGKIKKVLLASQCNTLFRNLHIRYVKMKDQTNGWELHGRIPKNPTDHSGRLYSAGTIEEIGAWMVFNHLFNETCVVNIIPNPTPVSIDEITRMFAALTNAFEPCIQTPVGFNQLLMKHRMARLFISVNFYAPKHQRHITHYAVIFVNTWGEMFFESVQSKDGLKTLTDLKADIKKQIKIDSFPSDAFVFARGTARKLH